MVKINPISRLALVAHSVAHIFIFTGFVRTLRRSRIFQTYICLDRKKRLFFCVYSRTTPSSIYVSFTASRRVRTSKNGKSRGEHTVQCTHKTHHHHDPMFYKNGSINCVFVQSARKQFYKDICAITLHCGSQYVHIYSFTIAQSHICKISELHV